MINYFSLINNEDADIDQWIEQNLISNNDEDPNGNLSFVQMKEIFEKFIASCIYDRKIKKQISVKITIKSMNIYSID